MKARGKQKAPADDPAVPPEYPSPSPTPGPIVTGSSIQSQGANDQATHHVQFAIDPLLLLEDPPQSGAPSNPNAIGPLIQPQTILINEAQMQQLSGVGYPQGIPVNGPMDGLPIYAVPASAGAILDRGSTPDVGNAIQGRQTQVSPRKKSRNADTRTIEEGQKLLMKESQGAKRTTRRR